MKTHLTLFERGSVHDGLSSGLSIHQIAQTLNRHPTTIANDIKKYRIFQQKGSFNRSFNPCLHRIDCARKSICEGKGCQTTKCTRNCSKCFQFCSSFIEEHCERLSQSPYVCNGCPKRAKCSLTKSIYDPMKAHQWSTQQWKQDRQGFTLSAEEVQRIDQIVSPLIKKGQSIHHILVNHRNQLMISEKTLYTLVHSGLLEARPLDCPRIVRFRPRKKKKALKLDRNYRVQRTYQDYLKLTKQTCDVSIVEMDSVLGQRESGKVLLTLLFTTCDLFLAFIRDFNDAASVEKIFDGLKHKLGHELFSQLFSVILTDNGSEFSHPTSLERGIDNHRLCRVFYCDPGMPQQKPHIENVHTLLRMVLPKGNSFQHLTQEDIDVVVSHINSYTRKKLNNLSPYKLFSSIYSPEILQVLHVKEINPNEVNLTPSLLTNR